jgi:hypothetical protein
MACWWCLGWGFLLCHLNCIVGDCVCVSNNLDHLKWCSAVSELLGNVEELRLARCHLSAEPGLRVLFLRSLFGRTTAHMPVILSSACRD